MILGIAVVLTCGLGGAVFGQDVVEAIGRWTGHDELVLRALGWCWSGLPFTLAAVLVAGHQRLGQSLRLALTYLLVVWAASGALLIPSRGSSMERRFGDTYPDARVLGFGWACGLLAVFATLLLTIVGVLVVHKLLGPTDKLKLRLLSRTLTVLWALLTAAGLAVALLAPLP